MNAATRETAAAIVVRATALAVLFTALGVFALVWEQQNLLMAIAASSAILAAAFAWLAAFFAIVGRK